LDNSMAMIWWLDHIKSNLISHCISLIPNSEAITLKCIVYQNYKLCTELSSPQVFYSLCIVVLFENCPEMLRYSYF